MRVYGGGEATTKLRFDWHHKFDDESSAKTVRTRHEATTHSPTMARLVGFDRLAYAHLAGARRIEGKTRCAKSRALKLYHWRGVLVFV